MPNQPLPGSPPRKQTQPTESDLDRDLDDTFPASDPIASEQRVTAKPPPRTDGQGTDGQGTDGQGKDQGILPTPTDEQKAQAEKHRRHLNADQERRH